MKPLSGSPARLKLRGFFITDFMVSIFKHSRETVPERNLSIEAFFDGIKNGQWQDEVLNYRAGRIDKKNLHAVTSSGIFKERKSNALIQHSGIICMDVDDKDQISTINIQDFDNDQYVYAYHKSASGRGGYAVYFKIDSDRHQDAFLGLEHYLFTNYSIVVDKSCKDISRLRFVSYDPDLYINIKSRVFKKYLKKTEQKIKAYNPIVVKSDFDEMVNQASTMNLFDSYDDYIKLAFALANEFGDEGEQYFHALCKSSSKYDEQKASQHYNKICKRNNTGVTISTVYYKFKEAGIKLTSERTDKIKTIAKLVDNPKEVLKELGIEDNENLIEKLKDPKKEKTELDEVIELIKLKKMKFNEVTRNFEIENEPIDDRGLAEFYTLVWKKIDDKISKDKIWTLIQSRDNTESFNPIHDFFLNNSHVKTNNEFQKLKQCFEIQAQVYMNNSEVYNVEDYLDTYLKKWLLGIVGSSFGTYSLMILVLVGEQGIKKTEFFRNLLPKELHKYYAESNLDEGKDSEILMCKKLLIVDDEFGGKSKKDATKLKRLSSQQTFSIRAPYGRVTEDLNRLAVLGGTSNDSEVINDPTGNRRIIPINLVKFDIDKYMSIDKTKLFIELYREWRDNQSGWFLTKDEIELLNMATLKNTDVWQEEEILLRHLKTDPYNFMTCSEIKLGLEKQFPSLKTNTKRIGQSLKKLNFDQVVRKINDRTMRVYNVILDF